MADTKETEKGDTLCNIGGNCKDGVAGKGPPGGSTYSTPPISKRVAHMHKLESPACERSYGSGHCCLQGYTAICPHCSVDEERVDCRVVRTCDDVRSRIPRNLVNIGRYHRWLWDDWAPECHGNYTHKLCEFAAGDIPYLAKVPNILANKFSLRNSPVAVDCVDWIVEWRSRDTSCEYLEFYKNALRGGGI